MKDNKTLKIIILITGILTVLLGIYLYSCKTNENLSLYRLDPGNPSVCKWY